MLTRSLLITLTAFLFLCLPRQANANEAQKWSIIPNDNNTLSFTTTQMGTSFTGHFNEFDTDISFSPERLSDSQVKVRVALPSAETGDDERDQTLQQEEWFHSKNHPVAVFHATQFLTNEGSNQNTHPFIAKGTLSLSGITKDVELSFSFEIDGTSTPSTAIAQGQTTLNRLDFGLGADNWDDPDSVGHNVVVQFYLHLEQE